MRVSQELNEKAIPPHAGKRRVEGLPPGVPNPVDVHVGSRVRLRRLSLGISQKKLAEQVGLTYQQIQKYESGTSRIGSGRLYEFSSILDVPVSFFFDDMPQELKASTTGRQAVEDVSDQPLRQVKADNLTCRETLELVRAYHSISEPSVRKRFFEMVKSVSAMYSFDDED